MKDEMKDFENQLSNALERVDAPVNFVECVMHRADIGTSTASPRASAPKWSLPQPWRWMMSPWAGGAVAALLVASVFLTGAHVHEEHIKRAQATQQFETATQITDRALAHAREAMKRAGVNPDE